MNVIPYRPEHVQQLQIQSAQTRLISCLPDGYLATLAQVGPAATAEHDGRIIACAGIAVSQMGSGTMWAFIAEDAGKHMLRLDRYARRLLEMTQLRRVEATTEADFPQGCRWLELLGFDYEGLMRAYGPHGEDHRRYARVA